MIKKILFMILGTQFISTAKAFDKMRELGDSTQALVVSPAISVSENPTLQFYEKQKGQWNLLFETPVVVGKKGFAPPGDKIEGDLKTPSGVFTLGTSWGYSETLATKMPYQQATSEDKFIDDPESEQYNQWVHGQTNAKSFEFMKREDGIYEYGIVINYNVSPVIKGKGSAIFLHIWRSSKSPTLGCIAMDKSALLKILGMLDPHKKPQIVINSKGKF